MAAEECQFRVEVLKVNLLLDRVERCASVSATLAPRSAADNLIPSFCYIQPLQCQTETAALRLLMITVPSVLIMSNLLRRKCVEVYLSNPLISSSTAFTTTSLLPSSFSAVMSMLPNENTFFSGLAKFKGGNQRTSHTSIIFKATSIDSCNNGTGITTALPLRWPRHIIQALVRVRERTINRFGLAAIMPPLIRDVADTQVTLEVGAGRLVDVMRTCVLVYLPALLSGLKLCAYIWAAEAEKVSLICSRRSCCLMISWLLRLYTVIDLAICLISMYSHELELKILFFQIYHPNLAPAAPPSTGHDPQNELHADDMKIAQTRWV
ncbi:hypothetical protein GALMADRAFT_137563 [Galerina marginata CBS 339.88]|uniref:Uncharacterized protein n=1 Tax=Galerina marginata (strain CBS 339.88) TaxID=685588 RepID=A0A067T841_GALM3|nr:hypothetical protein GALMADRAFT_137563 [Galerina marginata CBS 339.88]